VHIKPICGFKDHVAKLKKSKKEVEKKSIKNSKKK